ncbi:Dot/Icm type IV secretion system effector PhnB [soil metagenome]
MPVNPIPLGFHTVTPYFVVDGADGFIAFLKKAFNATEHHISRTPNGKVMHAQVRINDSIIMLSDSMPGHGANKPMMYLYVKDADAVFASALAAGGKELQPMKDQFYGDRCGAVTDPCGNPWWIASHVEDVSAEQMAKRQQEMAPKK